ncbi:putative glycolipid-binding domain-containing protein [Ruegeria faecimaris]|uniref:putative glycolipid-binding domain-containing protein n=1 Tax=Ruegeria faecimaris TaxID=686389 RepID=UPI0024924091|nr:putative glycolipid-binding domain-containing protein [Ruegeria faecimaris]
MTYAETRMNVRYGASKAIAMVEAMMRSTMWRRIDVVGTEACSVNRNGTSRVISGMAVYVVENSPVRIAYSVTCNDEWECSAATVQRWIGADRVDLVLVKQDDGTWTSNDKVVDAVDELLDIDLGFTPATNTNAIKRLQLGIGDQAEFTAVWLDDETWTFKPLKQRYERLNENTYRYTSINSGYEANLTVDGFGFVRVYPEYWKAVIA